MSPAGQCLKTIARNIKRGVGCAVPVGYCIFSPNGQYLLVSYLDSCIKLWNWQTCKCVATYSGHVNNICCIASDFVLHGADQQFIASGAEDGCMYFWDLHSKQVLDPFV